MNYNVSTIQNNLITVVGFDNSQNPQFTGLSVNLTTATSGIKINDGYIPYMTLENIKDLGINYDLFVYGEYNSSTTYIINNRIKYNYPSWDIATTYQTGELILYNNTGYKSLIDSNTGNQPNLNLDRWEALNTTYSIYSSLQDANINNQPDISSSYWTEVNLFNEFLENRLKSAISNVVDKCVKNKNQVLESKKIYYGIGDGSVTIENDNKICGIKIDFIKNENIKLKINRIGLHFSEAVTDLTFYVYNQNTQQATFTSSCISNDFVWIDVTDIEFEAEKQGSWFLYYKRSDLTTEKAINNEIYIPINLSNFIKINPFEYTDGDDLKLVDSEDYVKNSSFIANIDYSIVPDLTRWITYNKNLFAQSIKLQFAIDMYKSFLSTDKVRINDTERNMSNELLNANIYTKEAETLKKQLDDSIDELRISIGKAKIDNINLPTEGNIFNYNVDI